MQLTGIHHLTAVTANASGNRAFYVDTLGLRLVKKTVNQDDVSAYHLFYADGLASPGTDLTFFDWPVPREKRGTRSIVRTGLRVGSEASLRWWAKHFEKTGVAFPGIVRRDGRATIDFEDPEGQRLSLVEDTSGGEVHPWEKSVVPREHQIRGLGPITLSVPDLGPTDQTLTKLMNMRRVREYTDTRNAQADGDGSSKGPSKLDVLRGAGSVHVYEMGGGGPAAELHIKVEPSSLAARQGAGGVHHVAFRVPTVEEYHAWAKRLGDLGVPSSGPVDRYYFRSLYFREPNGILFELATDGPGFAVDEPMETLGERLALPPFLEPRRAEIEAGLKPL
jgi:glyoxalase family protein